jgi:hypothetical protein
LAIAVPNHPSYPSNHACISGAVALILDAQFPDQGSRYSQWPAKRTNPASTAAFHYRIDLDEGFVVARKVSARALAVGVPADRPFVALALSKSRGKFFI